MKMTQPHKREVRQAYAVFTPEPEGGFTVTFPEFPGCVTFGATRAEAKTMAAEVLELWLEELADNELYAIPDARPVIVPITTRINRHATAAR